MRKSILFILLFTIIGHQLYSFDYYIKFNALDCVNCTSSLNFIYSKVPNTKMVFIEDYESEINGIASKYNLTDFRDNFVFSDSLYNILNTEEFSQFIILEKEKIVYNDRVKNLNVQKFIAFLNAETEGDCTNQFPKFSNLKDYAQGTIVKDYVSDNVFYLRAADSKNVSLEMPPELYKLIYLKYLKDTVAYNHITKIQEHNALLRSKLVQAFESEDGTLVCNVICYKLDEVNGQDSMYGKINCIVKIKESKVTGIFIVDDAQLPEGYCVYEGYFFLYNDTLYSEVWNRELTNSKFIAQFILNSDYYVFYKLLDHELPKRINEYGFGSNYLRFLYHKDYLTYPLSEYIYNLKTKDSIKIGLPEVYFESNSMFNKSAKINYAIFDFKVNKNGNYSLIYSYDQQVWIAILDGMTGAIIKNNAWYSFAEQKQAIRSYCLSDDGMYVKYLKKGIDCLYTKPITSF